MRNRALLMQDVESLIGASRVETGSDVFALHQEEVGPCLSWKNIVWSNFDVNHWQFLVFTGSRYGSVRRFDTRV